jgi:hypothetical protein
MATEIFCSSSIRNSLKKSTDKKAHTLIGDRYSIPGTGVMILKIFSPKEN